jgi:hypothetical protein
MTAGLDVLRPTPSQRRRYAVPVSPADTRGVPRRRSSTNKDTAVEKPRITCFGVPSAPHRSRWNGIPDPAFSIGFRNAGPASDQPHEVGPIV